MGESVEFFAVLSEAEWDAQLSGWRCSALALPGANVTILVNGFKQDQARFDINRNLRIIRWLGTPEDRPTTKSGSSTIAVVTLTKRLTSMSVPVAVAIIGAISTLGSAAITARLAHGPSAPVSSEVVSPAAGSNARVNSDSSFTSTKASLAREAGQLVGTSTNSLSTTTNPVDTRGGESAVEVMSSGALSTSPTHADNATVKRLGAVERGGIQIDFYGCYRSGGNIRCAITLTNTREEREIELLAGSLHTRVCRAIDNAGRDRRATLVDIGGKEGSTVKVDVPNNVPLRGEVIFEDLAGTQSLSVIQVVFKYRLDVYAAEFRNVSLAA